MLKEDCYYNDYDRKENMGFSSKCVHGALGCDPMTGSLSFPIVQSATFKHRDFETSTGYMYSRLQSPTRQELERTMAILENGYEAFAYSSGQAANMSVFGMLKSGDHVILTDDIYGGTYRIGEDIFTPLGIEYEYVDLSDISELEKAMRPNTRMVFVETPTNPMMKVTDIREAARISHEHGAVFVVDNTFLTPYFQKPLDLGADIVVHSATKYICGHNDVLAGVVVIKDATYSDHFHLQHKSRGNCLSPFDCWLLIRGLKTLPLRMEKHDANARVVAEWLRKHPKVTKVYYAGFEDHINYAISKSQSTGFGGMISFELDSMETVRNLFNNVKMILFAESLGGTETLVTYPLTQTHESIPDDIRQKLGINERFIRISVGIENVEDIIADLKQALG